MLRSDDGGQTWLALKTDTSSSITDIVQMPNHEVIAVALDGVTLQSNDNGQHFQRMVGPDRADYTAVVAKSDGHPVYFTARGILLNH